MTEKLKREAAEMKAAAAKGECRCVVVVVVVVVQKANRNGWRERTGAQNKGKAQKETTGTMETDGRSRYRVYRVLLLLVPCVSILRDRSRSVIVGASGPLHP
jgi:hypothetical protein